MDRSDIRTAFRCLAPIVVASTLAGVSPDAVAGSAGTLYFETGKLLTNFKFVYDKDDNPDTKNLEQTFSYLNGCRIELDPGAGTPKLVSLTPVGGKGELGFVATSLGVYDGPQGTDCGRISANKNEALELAIGPRLVSEGAFLFDALHLDVEVKGDVVIRLEVKVGGAVVSTHYLTAGGGAAPADATNVFRCRDQSDSGPDSGPSDNCPWNISATGQSFRMTAVSGEFSLEGGGDYGADALANRTTISLIQKDGNLECGGTYTAANSTMSCIVDRLVYPDAAQCTAIPYVFRASGGVCTLTADPGAQQLVANLKIAYQPENATAGTLSDTKWPAAPLSKVSFGTAPGKDFLIPACRGVTISDPVNPAPIPETKPDWVPATSPVIEFACAYMRSESFNTESGVLKTLIEENIQFWGDIAFSRQ